MKVIEPDKKINWKSGKIHEISQKHYEEYIETLMEKYCSKDTTLQHDVHDKKQAHGTNTTVIDTSKMPPADHTLSSAPNHGKNKLTSHTILIPIPIELNNA